MHFKDRRDAGKQLAAALRTRLKSRLEKHLRGSRGDFRLQSGNFSSQYLDIPSSELSAFRSKISRDNHQPTFETDSKKFRGEEVVVYALPRGGVVLGFEVARALHAPLDLVIARKIGHPSNPEYAVCAVTEDGTLLCNELERASLDPEWLKQKAEKEREEAERRRKTYLKDKKHISAAGKIAFVVDDGVATGLTLRAALRSLRAERPKKLIVAVPVAPHEVVEILRKEADEVIVLEDVRDYRGAVGAYYDDFPQTTDEEVIQLLQEVRQ